MRGAPPRDVATGARASPARYGSAGEVDGGPEPRPLRGGEARATKTSALCSSRSCNARPLRVAPGSRPTTSMMYSPGDRAVTPAVREEEDDDDDVVVAATREEPSQLGPPAGTALAPAIVDRGG